MADSHGSVGFHVTVLDSSSTTVEAKPAHIMWKAISYHVAEDIAMWEVRLIFQSFNDYKGIQKWMLLNNSTRQ